MSAPRRAACAALGGALGVALLAWGVWIPAKAALAQVLLARAWVRVQHGEPSARPWPWADTTPVARLSVPAHGASAIVLEGATGRTLAFAPGHLSGSARPGAPGHSVVAGHRDTHFAFLRDLVVGDVVRVERPDGVERRYSVVELAVVHERDATVLAPTDRDSLTLLTCFPFDSPRPGGPLRYVAYAEALP